MDIIIDFFIQLFFESVADGFVSLCRAFVPGRLLSDKARRVVVIVFYFVAVALFAGLVLGIILLVETGGKSPLGLALVAFAVAYMCAGVVLKTVAYFKGRGRK